MRSTKNVTLRMRPPVRLAAAARRFAVDHSAATAVEYAVMTFIAIAIVLAVSQLGTSVTGMYERVQGIFD
jgi:Flp pilus assembly pilin Flp